MIRFHADGALDVNFRSTTRPGTVHHAISRTTGNDLDEVRTSLLVHAGQAGPATLNRGTMASAHRCSCGCPYRTIPIGMIPARPHDTLNCGCRHYLRKTGTPTRHAPAFNCLCPAWGSRTRLTHSSRPDSLPDIAGGILPHSKKVQPERFPW